MGSSLKMNFGCAWWFVRLKKWHIWAKIKKSPMVCTLGPHPENSVLYDMMQFKDADKSESNTIKMKNLGKLPYKEKLLKMGKACS